MAASHISSKTVIQPAARVRQIFVRRRIESLTERMDVTAGGVGNSRKMLNTALG